MIESTGARAAAAAPTSRDSVPFSPKGLLPITTSAMKAVTSTTASSEVRPCRLQ